MELDRMARGSWAIPQACAMCGEPATDGKPFDASVTLKRDYNMDRTGQLQSVSTASLDFKFPTCASCTRARKRKSRRDTLVGGIGIALGIIGLGAISRLFGYNVVSCVSLLVVWLAVAVGVDRLVGLLWRRSADADERRRADLPAIPVRVKRLGSQGAAPLIRFTFENDEYGEAFAAANP